MNIAKIIKDINCNFTDWFFSAEDSIEFEIAVHYLPEGYTKAAFEAFLANKKEKNRGKAIQILKDALKKYPNSTILLNLLMSLEYDKYSTEEEMDLHRRVYYELLHKGITPEVKNVHSILDIVGDKFKPGCAYYEELLAIKNKIEASNQEYYESFAKVLKSETPDEFKESILEFDVGFRKALKTPEICKTRDVNIDEIFNFFASNVSIYYEGFLTWYMNAKDYKTLVRYDGDFSLPIPDAIENLVDEKIINKEIFDFLKLYIDPKIIKETSKKVFFIYSKIFSIQGYPKASKRYLEISKSINKN